MHHESAFVAAGCSAIGCILLRFPQRCCLCMSGCNLELLHSSTQSEEHQLHLCDSSQKAVSIIALLHVDI